MHQVLTDDSFFGKEKTEHRKPILWQQNLGIHYLAFLLSIFVEFIYLCAL
jgi:hypothetical protein